VALIKAVVERFTARFEAVADATNTEGSPQEKLARHMRSSEILMRTSPEMFVVLNEIMIKARRDPDIAQLVSVPLGAWRRHIVSLILSPEDNDAQARRDADEIASVCMAQLLGMGLLVNVRDQTQSPPETGDDRARSFAVYALKSFAGPQS
jgi:hypothetical protein